MTDLFAIRDARETDMDLINMYSTVEGMDKIPGIERVRVATNADDEVVGFCRLQDDINGIGYVNPIVVYEPWRGYGVGRALIEDAQALAGELRLVARGSSRGFYEKLGFEPLSWDEVDLKAASEDCDRCPVRETCEPIPMVLYLPCEQ